MPNFAWSAATTMSQLIMISKPPASAEPFAAAMSGLGKSRFVMPPNPFSVIGNSPAAKALRSMPAENALSPAAGKDDDPDVVVALARDRARRRAQRPSRG